MPRKARQDVAGGIFHVCAHAVDGEDVFRDDEDRLAYTELLAKTIEKFEWVCLGYCLMGNHVHLLIETPKANRAAGIQWLHGRYVEKFNEKYSRPGHLFHRRHVAELVEDEAHLIRLCSYIPLNPVRAGFCNDPADWPWGSHSSVVRGNPPPWLSHTRLLERIEAILGAPVYDKLIEAQLMLTVPKPRGLTPGV